LITRSYTPGLSLPPKEERGVPHLIHALIQQSERDPSPARQGPPILGSRTPPIGGATPMPVMAPQGGGGPRQRPGRVRAPGLPRAVGPFYYAPAGRLSAAACLDLCTSDHAIADR